MLGCSRYFANQTLDFSRFHEEKCIQNDQQKLVGGLEHFFNFSIQLGMSSSQHIPTDELHHFSEGLNHRSPGSWISPRLLKVASFAFERYRSHHNVVILIRISRHHHHQNEFMYECIIINYFILYVLFFFNVISFNHVHPHFHQHHHIAFILLMDAWEGVVVLAFFVDCIQFDSLQFIQLPTTPINQYSNPCVDDLAILNMGFPWSYLGFVAKYNRSGKSNQPHKWDKYVIDQNGSHQIQPFLMIHYFHNPNQT